MLTTSVAGPVNCGFLGLDGALFGSLGLFSIAKYSDGYLLPLNQRLKIEKKVPYWLYQSYQLASCQGLLCYPSKV